MQKIDINNFIPIDDLYWDEVDKKYIVFSEGEMERLCLIGIKYGLNTEELHQAINTFSMWRAQEKILKRIFSGQLYFKVKNEEVLIGHD
jgi:hypothetical protein